MKKISYPLCSLVIMTLLSCNLFIDDEILSDNDFREVPVHTGEGYDAPITVYQSGCEITYQYKSNVRVLTQDVQDRYILSVERDNVNALMEIHYAVSTPLEELPVPGEILTSTVTEKFPWGCNHEVMYRLYEDGVYKYMLGFVSFQDTFEDLRINGKLDYSRQDIYYAVDDSPNENNVDSDMASGGNGSNADTRTRGNDGFNLDIKNPFNKDEKIGGASFKDGACRVALDDHPWQLGAVQMKNGVTFDATITYSYETVMEFDFTNFDLKALELNIRVTETTMETTTLAINGGYNATKRLFRIPAVPGVAVAAGPVVLVFFVNIDFNIVLNVTVTATFKKEKIVKKIYDIDMLECNVEQKKEVIKDEDFKFDGITISGTVDFRVDFQFGMGFWGKIISLRIIPSLHCLLKVSSPNLVKEEEGINAYDITGKEGLEWHPLQISVTVGVFLDLSLKKLLGAFKTVGDEAQKELLEELQASTKEKSDFYQNMVDIDNAAYDPNKKYYVKKTGKSGKEQQTQEGTEEVGLSWTSPSIDIIPPLIYTWYPTIEDKSFKVYTKVEKNVYGEKIKWQCQGTYKIDQGPGKGRYKAALGVALQTIGGIKKETVLPIEKDAYVKRGKEFHFVLPEMEDNKVYMVYPIYIDEDGNASAFDKALPLNLTYPKMDITRIEPVGSYILTDSKNPENPELFDGRYYYKYRRDFVIDTYTTVVREDKFYDWKLYCYVYPGADQNRQTRIEKKKKEWSHDEVTSVSHSYCHHWKIKTFCDYEEMIYEKWKDAYNKGNTNVIRFQLDFKVDKSDDNRSFINTCYLWLLPDGSYRAYKDWFAGTIDNGDFPPMSPSDDPTKNRASMRPPSERNINKSKLESKHGNVIVELEAIECDGKIIWQLPEYKKPAVTTSPNYWGNMLPNKAHG